MTSTSRPAWSRDSAVLRLGDVTELRNLGPDWAWGGSQGRGVRVAVVDSGIEHDHPDLGGRVDTQAGVEVLLGEGGEVTLVPGDEVLWDGRFWVTVAKSHAGAPLKLRPLGEVALRDLRRRRLVGPEASRGGATVPALWRGEEIVAVPSLGYWASAHHRDELRAVFLGLGYAPNAAGPGDRPEPRSSLKARTLS